MTRPGLRCTGRRKDGAGTTVNGRCCMIRTKSTWSAKAAHNLGRETAARLSWTTGLLPTYQGKLDYGI